MFRVCAWYWEEEFADGGAVETGSSYVKACLGNTTFSPLFHRALKYILINK